MQTAVFPGDYKSLEKIGNFIKQAAEASGLDESAAYAVQLAVDEACSNIIEHAYGGEGLGEIKCSVQTLDDGLKVVLCDRGRPFDPDKVPAPDLTAPLEELKARGLGLHWMHKLVDEVHFQFGVDATNILTLIKRRRKG
ncbi:MAG TPA: ATP-binding protein [Anaerolineales bacterium]